VAAGGAVKPAARCRSFISSAVSNLIYGWYSCGGKFLDLVMVGWSVGWLVVIVNYVIGGSTV
jgi:hypothetical protein